MIWGAGWRSDENTRRAHQCSLSSIPRLGITCGLSLLVLYSAPRGFSPGIPVFPSREHLPRFAFIVNFSLQCSKLVSPSARTTRHIINSFPFLFFPKCPKSRMEHCNNHLKLSNNIKEILQKEREAWMDINVQDWNGLHLGHLEKGGFFLRIISFVM